MKGTVFCLGRQFCDMVKVMRSNGFGIEVLFPCRRHIQKSPNDSIGNCGLASAISSVNDGILAIWFQVQFGKAPEVFKMNPSNFHNALLFFKQNICYNEIEFFGMWPLSGSSGSGHF